LNNGMGIVHVFSDWMETPVTSDSYGMVYVCIKMSEVQGFMLPASVNEGRFFYESHLVNVHIMVKLI
jgi:hypothetical protein